MKQIIVGIGICLIGYEVGKNKDKIENEIRLYNKRRKAKKILLYHIKERCK
jgi:hypothetical protein